ncbi:MAG TPA: hypothetical protein VGV59_02205 [Pyrinomonadaceae bacterium]|nr:hypothetical protein [Pyrinomonadaceae bacterium]
MRSRRIKLEDGRYLIFYTFDEETAQADERLRRTDAAGQSDSPRVADEGAAEPVSKEERRV